MILSDNETKVDMLNNRAIAKTVVEVIKDCEDRPISIGVHGDWGAGKSSVLAMIEDEFFDNKEGIECIRFNGWRHQGFEDSKIALMSGIVSELTKKRKLGEETKDTLKNLWKSINWMSVVKFVGGAVLSASTGIPSTGLLSMDFLKSRSNKKSDTMINQDNSLSKEFSDFQRLFAELLEKSKIKKLIVLIDDLDRCLPKVTIETLEAVRLFMFTESTAFVIAADESMIEYAVRNHFPDISIGEDEENAYSKRYLEKLIQVPFRIPTLGKVESEMYITLLLISSVLKEGEGVFENLLSVAIGKMKKPWENAGFTGKEIHEIFDKRFSEIEEQFAVSNQISDILTKNTQGNPRKIKRFINMLLLRKQIAEARGFGNEIEIPVMAKMMLAEHFFRERYKEISTHTDDNGVCVFLHESEKQFEHDEISKNTRTANETNVQNEVEKDVESIGWGSDKEFMAWVHSEPRLGSVDLRPYFFASKGNEDFFFEIDDAKRFEYLISRLMASDFNVKNAIGDIKALSKDDAIKIFKSISKKIMKNSDISKKPAGIDGIREIVTHHKFLEHELVALIITFNHKKVGAWICSGWSESIKSVKIHKELIEYYEKLSNEGATQIIREAAKMTLK